MKIVKPNFFLIGAAKSGTTALSVMLGNHPQVYISPIKEPNFFSKDIDISSFSAEYRKITFLAGDDYFRQKPLKKEHLSFIRQEHHYYALFEEAGDETAIGECSTSYLYSQVAAREIRNFNPEAKILVILRNPVNRAFSHYQMALKYGLTNLPLTEEVERDFKQQEKGWGISRLYIELGMYGSQLERYYQCFSPHQVLVLFHEDLIENQEDTFKKICLFLEVDPLKPELTGSYNEAVLPRFPWLNKVLTYSGLRKLMKENIPEKTRKRLSAAFFTRENLPKMSNDEKEFLLGFFKEDIQKTAMLTGRNLDHWLS